MKRLDGKVALITGAARGIGAATAERFVEEGAQVMLTDVLEPELRALADRLGAGFAAWQVVDASQRDQVERSVEAAVEQFGGLDIAVLNAGIFGEMQAVDQYSESLFDRVLEINLKGVWHGLRTAIGPMRRRGGGSIVITSSTQGHSGYYLSSPYTTTKHAVVGIMRNAAVELAVDNIRVNTVHPGLTDTEMMGGLHRTASPDDPSAAMQAFATAPPMRRYGSPREVANMMLFLASDEASYCTGSCYMVDGGLLAYHGGPPPGA